MTMCFYPSAGISALELIGVLGSIYDIVLVDINYKLCNLFEDIKRGLPMSEERTYTGLRRFNLVMGFLHLAQGIFMIAISNATTFPIYTNFLRFDPAKMTLVPNRPWRTTCASGRQWRSSCCSPLWLTLPLATFGYKWYVAKLEERDEPGSLLRIRT